MAQQQWEGQDPMVLAVLSFLDVPTLERKKLVCQKWNRLCTIAITLQKRPFRTKQELRAALEKYVKYNPKDAEEFANTYGWPINKWDVSQVQDFSLIFQTVPSSMRILVPGMCPMRQPWKPCFLGPMHSIRIFPLGIQEM